MSYTHRVQSHQAMEHGPTITPTSTKKLDSRLTKRARLAFRAKRGTFPAEGKSICDLANKPNIATPLHARLDVCSSCRTRFGCTVDVGPTSPCITHATIRYVSSMAVVCVWSATQSAAWSPVRGLTSHTMRRLVAACGACVMLLHCTIVLMVSVCLPFQVSRASPWLIVVRRQMWCCDFESSSSPCHILPLPASRNEGYGAANERCPHRPGVA